MGQAKQRESREERIKQAQDQKLEGERISIEEAKKRLNLPEGNEFRGYVINLPDRDEFLSTFDETEDLINTAYAKIPDLARVFHSIESAVEVAEEITKHKLLICLLFESDKQYFTQPVWANFDE
ncbi:hypothetical protein [Acinetobacter pseudolwoffii]|uniref:Uncharacterized protein n=1 Tax=Acinetobacter pseudolwoffii TaxID=2053287 RepID=A0A2H9UPD9_9GAMM|nr:hypothetical protein [Acinetobacter pseudolwoffii]PJI33578.1 hypothetical protein CU320_04065 [Acinetobacter pseudolwoffii]